MPNVLEKIMEKKRDEIAEAKSLCPASELEKQLASAPEPRGFAEALRTKSQKTGMALIAEVKKASPSAGVIKADFDPVGTALTYERGGASCLSVLTDVHFFQGSLEYLKAVHAAVKIPVLRKDFMLDRYQVLEARAAGADCILLIAECLDDCGLRDLYFYAHELGMDVLIEIYDPENLDRVLKLEPELLGINNRDLRTFVVDLEHSIRLGANVPKSSLLVSESGIRDGSDVERLKKGGCRAILVGETLMKSGNIEAKIHELMGG